MPRDISKSLRFEQRSIDQLENLANRWNCTQTSVLELALRLMVDLRIAASIGDSYGAVEQALRAWALQLERASADNARTFDRAEWNMMADVQLTYSPPRHRLATGAGLHGGDLAVSPATMIWPNIYDGHRLNGAGYKWLGQGKRADQRVAQLVDKVRDLDDTHSWAVVVAIQFFWEHCQQVDHAERDWWTVDFRRNIIEGD